MNSKKGSLFIVATPIGNLDDMTNRAKTVLSQVSLILAEDTRHAAKLLSHYGIATKVRSFYEQNEKKQTPKILEMLDSGSDVAVISDAGTPLISDPGYALVREARENNFPVSPIPGASAVTAVLSVCGLPTDRFCFEGFLPAKQQQRQRRLELLRNETRTLVFYESNHRVLESLQDMYRCFGERAEVSVAREVSKKFETFYYGDFTHIIAEISAEANQQKGEFVIVVSTNADNDSGWAPAKKLTLTLLKELPVKSACKIAAETFGVSKNRLYESILADKQHKP